MHVNEPVSPGIEEWNYQQLTAEEVGNHLAQYMIDSEPNVTAEGIQGTYGRRMRVAPRPRILSYYGYC